MNTATLIQRIIVRVTTLWWLRIPFPSGLVNDDQVVGLGAFVITGRVAVSWHRQWSQSCHRDCFDTKNIQGSKYVRTPYNVRLRAFVIAVSWHRQWWQSCHRDCFDTKTYKDRNTSLQRRTEGFRNHWSCRCLVTPPMATKLSSWLFWHKKHTGIEIRPYNVGLRAFLITGCVAVSWHRQWRQSCHRDCFDLKPESVLKYCHLYTSGKRQYGTICLTGVVEFQRPGVRHVWLTCHMENVCETLCDLVFMVTGVGYWYQNCCKTTNDLAPRNWCFIIMMDYPMYLHP